MLMWRGPKVPNENHAPVKLILIISRRCLESPFEDFSIAVAKSLGGGSTVTDRPELSQLKAGLIQRKDLVGAPLCKNVHNTTLHRYDMLFYSLSPVCRRQSSSR